MKIGIPKETTSEERRVAATPETVAKMIKAGMDVFIAADAGERSFITDEDYIKAGAHIEVDNHAVYQQADVILKVQVELAEVEAMKDGTTLIAPLYPSRHLQKEWLYSPE